MPKAKDPEKKLQEKLAKATPAEVDAARAIIFRHVKKELKPILQAITDKAKGIKVLHRDRSGFVEVYTEPPNVDAAKFLTEQALGKPKEAIEVTERRTINIDC